MSILKSGNEKYKFQHLSSSGRLFTCQLHRTCELTISSISLFTWHSTRLADSRVLFILTHSMGLSRSIQILENSKEFTGRRLCQLQRFIKKSKKMHLITFKNLKTNLTMDFSGNQLREYATDQTTGYFELFSLGSFRLTYFCACSFSSLGLFL